MDVFLRELERIDIEILNIWRNKKSLIDSLGTNFRYINLDTDINWYDNYIKNRTNNVRCIICENETSKQIGSIGLLNIDNINKKCEFYIMIGDEEYQNKGIGRKAIVQILNHGFMNLNLNRVELNVLKENERALNLYLKVGFKQEGIFRNAIYKNGKYSDLIYMGLLKDEFLNKFEI